jgi:hypothetical protein
MQDACQTFAVFPFAPGACIVVHRQLHHSLEQKARRAGFFRSARRDRSTVMRILNFVLVASVLSALLMAIALVSALLTSVVHGQFAPGSIGPSIIQNY